jgi:mono/diheme cytochrome c family protein
MSRRRIALALIACCHAPLVLGDETAAGRALYESRCDACHDKSVHNRAARKSRNVGEIRQWVARWNTELGGAWTGPEIDAVTRYLNQRFYKFPCPPAICKRDKA